MKKIVYGLSAVALAVCGSAFTKSAEKVFTNYYFSTPDNGSTFSNATVPTGTFPTAQSCSELQGTACEGRFLQITLVSTIHGVSTTYAPKGSLQSLDKTGI